MHKTMTMIYLSLRFLDRFKLFFSNSQGQILFQIIMFNILFWPCKLISRIHLENNDSYFVRNSVDYAFDAKKFDGLPYEVHLPTTYFYQQDSNSNRTLFS